LESRFKADYLAGAKLPSSPPQENGRNNQADESNGDITHEDDQ
jgi:hypothetical protein